MISQRCPKCRSSRIRRGYKPTPLLLRMVGIQVRLAKNPDIQDVARTEKVVANSLGIDARLRGLHPRLVGSWS